MTRVRILLIALLCASAFGQASETAPKFLAADVRHSKSISVPSMIGPVTSGDTYKVRYALLIELVRRAYGIVDSVWPAHTRHNDPATTYAARIGSDIGNAPMRPDNSADGRNVMTPHASRRSTAASSFPNQICAPDSGREK